MPTDAREWVVLGIWVFGIGTLILTTVEIVFRIIVWRHERKLEEKKTR